MKKLIFFFFIASLLVSCKVTNKTADGQPVIYQGKHGGWVMGNARKYHERAVKATNKARKEYISNQHL
jgi:hypothetical protein